MRCGIAVDLQKLLRHQYAAEMSAQLLYLASVGALPMPRPSLKARLARAIGFEGVAELLMRNWSLALGRGMAWFCAPASMVPAAQTTSSSQAHHHADDAMTPLPAVKG